MIPLYVCKKLAIVNSRHYSSSDVLDPFRKLFQILELSIHYKSLKLTQQSHARIFTSGFAQNAFLATKLIHTYFLCGDPTQSHLVFDAIQRKNVFLWNTLINGYAKDHVYDEVFHLFNRMCWGCESPDEFTIATIAKLSSEFKDLTSGKSIHGRSIRSGFVPDVVLVNSLMLMYCKCENFDDARKLFDEMPLRSVASWNVLIAGFFTLGDHSFNEEVWECVKCMHVEGLKPDSYTISTLLSSCGVGSGNLNCGRELHCFIVKNELDLGFSSDIHLGCCLIDMYSKNGDIILGRRVFDRMKCKNVIAWTAMINGYTHNGSYDEAFDLFREMQMRGQVEPNKVSLVTVLHACSSLLGLMGVKQIHGFSIRKELLCEVSLSNALIDTYSKSGGLYFARWVFENGSFLKDSISWSSMICGYGLHGKGEEAIVLYEKMLRLGIKPDTITIVGVLSACGRSGLVNEGLDIYNSMINDYEIEPTIEICACVVDMLGRSGELDRAFDFIRKMHMKPGPSIWGALVSASITHGNTKMRDLAYKCLVKVEPENPSNYVSLSNLYASSMQWDFVAEVRTVMKGRGLRKLPGCSWISINSKTHCFYVADKAHPCYSQIYEMLDYLILTMKGSYSLDSEISTQIVGY